MVISHEGTRAQRGVGEDTRRRGDGLGASSPIVLTTNWHERQKRPQTKDRGDAAGGNLRQGGRMLVEEFMRKCVEAQMRGCEDGGEGASFECLVLSSELGAGAGLIWF